MRFFQGIKELWGELDRAEKRGDLMCDEMVAREKIFESYRQYLASSLAIHDAFQKLSDPCEQQKACVRKENNDREYIEQEEKNKRPTRLQFIQEARKIAEQERVERLQEQIARIKSEGSGWVLVDDPKNTSSTTPTFNLPTSKI
ncbi:MAG: hypothetical protein ACD_70C00101G0001 [uncultured bacterium]|nr:MAG: hypothetical protein ACD_70C00101G0001 [uncultured bacterium]OGT25585.1 MAG: hypothetical protein A3B71_06005 [Gammaproteobacteria bacterium RIFCSPHIGHO2_02_FULL_42_43]OGT28964.1 MAG: hypothetical protein A2624_02950 [Gammaproteobacteria bacterium RIFCSPHIGHO2_01_FULL_42_8]OGT51539.1 MAG: hypothetical protein A3E54_05770 [Gammaproteobacteria bacterium RIFCSPHIGHO2_12_FULL_41_25]OGT62239.1 MAG: hypothetical protein A3I77_04705 [Gammaproteobacteria bacterium RIFCSPLOWO2_02_FULL_42_14]OGT